ncbi:MAG: hypothetical protein ACLP7Q_18485 [Isosphaeraceae bacterium]
MIDIATERLINLPEAAKILPSARAGRPVHPSTVWRLIVSGELEGLYSGNRWITSVEALQRHLERKTEAALNKANGVQRPKAKNLHGKRREAQLAAVDSELKAAGL